MTTRLRNPQVQDYGIQPQAPSTYPSNQYTGNS